MNDTYTPVELPEVATIVRDDWYHKTYIKSGPIPWRVYSNERYVYHNDDHPSVGIFATKKLAEKEATKMAVRSLFVGDALRMALNEPERARELLSLFEGED